MEKKKFTILALILLTLIVVFEFLDKMTGSMNFSQVFTTINPLLYIGVLVCGYFIASDKFGKKSKGTWLSAALLATMAIERICTFFVVFGEMEKGYYTVSGAVLTAISALIGAVAVGFLLYSFLAEKNKFMVISFGALAITVIIDVIAGATALYLIFIVAFILFALIALDILPDLLKRLFRTLIVVFVLIALGEMTMLTLFTWIALALTLVPLGKFKINFAKIVAILCVIVAILTFVAYMDNNGSYEVEYIQDEIEEMEATIEDYANTLNLDREDVNQNYIDEQNVLLEKAEAELNKAENEKDRVCYRSSYSWWYCDDECYELHQNVEAKERAVDNIESKIDKAEYIIDQEEVIKHHKIDLFAAVINMLIKLVAMLLALAALIMFAICNFRSKYGKLALISFASMAASSLIYVFIDKFFTVYWKFELINNSLYQVIFSPYFWNVVIMGLFALMVAKPQVKAVRNRIWAVIIAVIVLLIAYLSALSMLTPIYALIFGIYEITMICAAFVLVPAVYTEYNGIAKHIFFSFITLGIWQMIWIFNVTKNLNKVEAVKQRKPLAELLLCLLLPFYYVYWLYKTAAAVETYGAENGKQYKIEILCLAFAFVCPLVSSVIIQDKINEIVGKPE